MGGAGGVEGVGGGVGCSMHPSSTSSGTPASMVIIFLLHEGVTVWVRLVQGGP